MNDASIAHTRWNCQYHIVFIPKYRKKVIFNGVRKDLGQILRKLCEMKGVTIIAAATQSDHVHMLVSIPPKLSVSEFMGYLNMFITDILNSELNDYLEAQKQKK